MMNRLYWIDSLKFFGIYLVVLGHCTFLTEKLDMFIYLFHMPLFYLISGFLSHKDKRDFSEILRSSVKRFLVPYFFFRLLGWLWWFFFSYERHPELFSRDGITFFKPLFAILLGLGYNTDFAYTVCTPAWFLFSLFWLKIFSNYILTSWIRCLSIVAFSIVLIKLFDLLDFHLYFSLENALLALPFFVIGFYIKKSEILRFIDKKYFVLLLFFCILGFYIQLGSERVDMNRICYGDSLFLFYLLPILFTVVLMKFFSIYFNKKYDVVEKISSGAIVVIGIHQYLLFIFNKIGGSNFVGIIMSLIVLLLCLFFIKLFNKYIPFLIGNKI